MTAKIILAAIRAYQVTLSPLFGGWCRFEPSCSVYASEAIRMHGAMRGSWLAIKRVARCHPFGSYGFDSVPPRAELHIESPAARTQHAAPSTQPSTQP